MFVGATPNVIRAAVMSTTGLPAALTQYLPAAEQQRCTVHKIRGLEVSSSAWSNVRGRP